MINRPMCLDPLDWFMVRYAQAVDAVEIAATRDALRLHVARLVRNECMACATLATDMNCPSVAQAIRARK